MADEPDTFSEKDLVEADWAALDKLKHALETGGQEELVKASQNCAKEI